MIKGIWGKKIGMTQVFSENRVVPVTVIDVSNWFVTHVKTKERDGYNAAQIGRVRVEYAQQEFSEEWLAEPKKYFSVMREIPLVDDEHTLGAGSSADLQQYWPKAIC